VDLKRIQAYMGHASLAMTVDTYGHLLKTGEEEARAAMNAFLAEERQFPDYDRACAWEKQNLDRLLRV